MYKSFIIVFALALAAVVCEKSDRKAKYLANLQNCATTNNVTLEMVDGKPKLAKTENTMCVRRCMAVKHKKLNDKFEVNMDMVKKHAKKDVNVDEVVKSCVEASKQEKKCVKEMHILKCVSEKALSKRKAKKN